MIRNADPADASLISALHCSAFERGWKEREIIQLFDSGNVHGWLHTSSNQVNAFLLVRAAGEETEILAIAVEKSHRQQGLAKALLHTLHDAAKQHGWKKIFLEVAEDNLDAVALYEKALYRVFHRRKAYYQRWHGKRVDALMMEKSIH